MSHFLNQHIKKRKLTTLVENRTIYSAKYSELNIFETYENAEKINLKFNYPIIASMLTGKKIMYLEKEPFEFIPGESLIMPTNNEMIIDFPEASINSPTQCLALGIDSNKIEEIVYLFNNQVQIENENNNWQLNHISSHLINSADVSQLIQRLIHTFTYDNKTKDVLIDLMIKELIVRLLQTKAKSVILKDIDNIFHDTRIGTTVKFIKNNLTNKDISVDLLAEKACMSVSNFHKKFKSTLGISPIDYLNSEKIKFSKRLIIENKGATLSEIAFKTGYNSVSYFIRKFKEHELMTPKQYLKLFNQEKLH